MTRSELIQDIQAYITGSYGIPPKLSEAEIGRRIDDALRWFYRNYDQATQSKYYIITKNHFKTDAFLEARELELPSCVVSVSECRVISNASSIALGQDDLSISRMVAADIFLSSYNSDDLVNRVAYAAYYDLSRAFIKDFLRYKYNYNTHTLVLEGDPDMDVYIRTYDKINETSLFDDHYFIDYIRGACLESMGRMMSVIKMDLPGGAVINTEMLRSQGEKMMTDVKTQIDEDQPGGYVEFYHGG